jgi:hypothetical protein
MANLQEAKYDTDSDTLPVYDINAVSEVSHFNTCHNNDIFDMSPHEEQHSEKLTPTYDTYLDTPSSSNTPLATPDVNHNGGFVSQHAENDEETRALFESLLHNCGIEIEKVKKVNCDVKAANVKLTTELERYKENAKSFQINKERESEFEIGYKKLLVKDREWKQKFTNLEISSTKTINSLNQEISELTNQLSKQKTAYSNLEKERDELKKDFAKKEDKLLEEIVESEHMIAHLEELVVIYLWQIFTIKLEKENVSYFKQLDRKSEECKYDKLSYERAFKNMKKQNDHLRAQLESQKGKGAETKFAKPSTSEKPNVSNTVNKPKMSISRFAPKVDEKKDLTKPVNQTPLPKQSENEKILDKGKAVVETPKVIAPGLFRISPTNASASTSKTNDKGIKDNSKESRYAKKDNNINPNACALPSTGLESTSRSSRLKPKSNTRNNRVSSASKSSSKNKVEEVEEHPRNLSLCNKKHDSSECNVESTGSNACNDSVCLKCKKSLINDVHDECVSKNVNVTPEQKTVPNRPSARSRSLERLVARFRSTTISRMPRNYFKYCMWIPTGREFTFQDGKLEVVTNKNTAIFDECDSVFTPNPMEPNSKRFPNTNSSVLGRLSKYVFGSSTRVAPST